MFWDQIIVSLAEFLLTIFLAVFVVFWSYKSFDKINTGFDAQTEIYNGNVAVATLMAALMFATSRIMREAIYPVISILQVGITGGGHALWTLGLYAIGHLFFAFLLSVGCVQFAMKFFAKLNSGFDEIEQIHKGNTAVAVIMGAVILIVAMFMQSGVSALTKSLIPQPELGDLRIMD
ncbi:MAG: hypothetical protein CO113_13585 [Elusimicrobia bacterium CG_4_9_14_3_um_filter_62_55]|nr:MAG: hypothetical protein COR54_17475 [Elusimicrobia bacterium CG22_combo_CG10-13_8_21_14_all_63_91]PJA18461.1 MAG: hypothetical protein COX66_00975 [Elusimicrobia bacterium CG_4_10_14_0_2_um_filter_63_34]PJB24516.1 MAG: hypothetical protein CO113_13585 [Elusimicrobia bacterium CG_4_9_14_3_um_filter_62_55]